MPAASSTREMVRRWTGEPSAQNGVIVLDAFQINYQPSQDIGRETAVDLELIRLRAIHFKECSARAAQECERAIADCEAELSRRKGIHA